MTITSTLPVQRGVAPLTQLARRLTGTVALPGEPGYAAATPWNVAVPFAPRAVVAAADAEDVAATVRFARRYGLRVAVQRTGHGSVAVGDDVLLVHTGRLDAVTVDPATRTARTGAGAVWTQVIEAAAAHGLAPLCGSSPGVGVAGFLSGGGLGPLARTYGVSSDRVLALEVVTGDGRVRRATPTEHADLFWGLRGGKGTLGIITAVEMELVPLAGLYGGALWFDGEQAPAVLAAWRELCATLPEAGTTSLALVRLPALPHVPPPLAGRLTVAVRFAWTGDTAEGERLLAPLRAAAAPLVDTVAVMPYAAIGSIHADPVDPMPTTECSALLHGLPEGAAQALLAAAGPRSASRQTIVELRHLGGAVAREPQHPSAFCHRDAAFSLLTIGVPVPPDAGGVVDDARRVVDALDPWATGWTLPNFSASADPARIARSYDPATLHLLAGLADHYDPAGVLRTGQVAR